MTEQLQKEFLTDGFGELRDELTPEDRECIGKVKEEMLKIARENDYFNFHSDNPNVSKFESEKMTEMVNARLKNYGIRVQLSRSKDNENMINMTIFIKRVVIDFEIQP